MAQQAETIVDEHPPTSSCERISLMGSHTMPGQHSQHTPTLLFACKLSYNLPPALLGGDLAQWLSARLLIEGSQLRRFDPWQDRQNFLLELSSLLLNHSAGDNVAKGTASLFQSVQLQAILATSSVALRRQHGIKSVLSNQLTITHVFNDASIHVPEIDKSSDDLKQVEGEHDIEHLL